MRNDVESTLERVRRHGHDSQSLLSDDEGNGSATVVNGDVTVFVGSHDADAERRRLMQRELDNVQRFRDLEAAGGAESWARPDAGVDTRRLQVYLSSLATDAVVTPPPPSAPPAAPTKGPKYSMDGRRVRLTPAQKAAIAQRRRHKRELALLRRQHRGAVLMQSVVRGFLGRRSVAWLRHHIAAFAASMATRIQSAWRVKAAREVLARARAQRRRDDAATEVQRVVRGRRGRRRAAEEHQRWLWRRRRAATRIQSQARRRIASRYVLGQLLVLLLPPCSCACVWCVRVCCACQLRGRGAAGVGCQATRRCYHHSVCHAAAPGTSSHSPPPASSACRHAYPRCPPRPSGSPAHRGAAAPARQPPGHEHPARVPWAQRAPGLLPTAPGA